MKSDILSQIYGDYTPYLVERLESLSPRLSNVVQDIAYSQFWTKDGLDLKTKCLITVTSLVALGRPEQLKIHIRGFLNQGGTIEELEDVFLHLIVYCGFPSIMNAFSVLKELKEEDEISQKSLNDHGNLQ